MDGENFSNFTFVLVTRGNFFIVAVRNLEEGRVYKFQVLAMSTNDYEAASPKYIYHVPIFPVKKPLLIGAIGGAFLVTILLSLVWYCIKPGRKTD